MSEMDSKVEYKVSVVGNIRIICMYFMILPKAVIVAKLALALWSVWYKDLRGNPETLNFPGPDWTETGPGSGNIFKNIFVSGRVGEFYFRSRYFLLGMRHFFQGFRG